MAIRLTRSGTQRVNLLPSNNAFQNVNEGTLMCWVNVVDVTTSQEHVAAFSIGTSDTSARMYLSLNRITDTTFDVQGSSRRLDADAVQAIGTSGSAFAVGTWHHLALVCTFNGQSQILYVDGNNVASATPAGWTGATSNTASAQAGINGLANGSGNFANTTTQDVRVYQRALAAAEIRQIWKARGGDRVRRTIFNRYILNNGAAGATAASNSARDYGPAARTGDPTNSPTWAAGIRTRPSPRGWR